MPVALGAYNNKQFFFLALVFRGELNKNENFISDLMIMKIFVLCKFLSCVLSW